MRPITFALAAVALSLATAAGCNAPGSLYAWGSYEAAAYETCRGHGDPARLSESIRDLSADIERARAEGRRVPPGAHAHLGYLHSLAGNGESAAVELAREKELYPESAVFVDGCLARMRK